MDYYHSAETIKDSLECALQPGTDSGEVRVDYLSVAELPDALADKPYTAIMFKENRLNPADERVEYRMREKVAHEIARYVFFPHAHVDSR